MGVLKHITHTTAYQIYTGKKFIEKATLQGTGNATLTIYDGTGTDGRVIAVVGCLANSFSSDDNINEKCVTGVHAVITTGAGLAQAVIYER